VSKTSLINNGNSSMQRRDLANSAMAGVATVVALPVASSARTDPNANVIFTSADPGHWKEVEVLHFPIVVMSVGPSRSRQSRTLAW
jgi:hypothetical protein